VDLSRQEDSTPLLNNNNNASFTTWTAKRGSEKQQTKVERGESLGSLSAALYCGGSKLIYSTRHERERERERERETSERLGLEGERQRERDRPTDMACVCMHA